MFRNEINLVDDVIIRHKINKRLLDKRGIEDKNIIAMGYYYDKIKIFFELSNKLEKVKYKISKKQYLKEAKRIGKEVHKAEKQLQKFWKFEENPNYYTHWYLIPGCQCPKLDNEEHRGRGRIINKNCYYHNFLIKGGKK